jgi:hypothetical protein
MSTRSAGAVTAVDAVETPAAARLEDVDAEFAADPTPRLAGSVVVGALVTSMELTLSGRQVTIHEFYHAVYGDMKRVLSDGR